MSTDSTDSTVRQAAAGSLSDRKSFTACREGGIYEPIGRKIQELIMAAIGFLPALLLPSCHGVFGLVTANGGPANGGYATEVRSAGFEIRNLPGYRGLTVGSRSTSYFHPDGAESPSSSSSWGVVALPDGEPVFTRSATRGVDLAWEPSFRGVSVGIDSRACAALRPDQSAVLHVNTTAPSLSDRYQYQTTP